MKTALLLTSLIALCAATTELFYTIDGISDDAVTKCALSAMEKLEESTTCVSFTESPIQPTHAFIIVHSSECAWQPSNKSVHLSSDCISDNVCTELIGKAVGVDRPALDVPHFLGQKLNCTGPCGGLRCEHGGRLSLEECACTCPYAFGGMRCETLKRLGSYNDAACGVIEAQDAGSVALSTYPGDQAKGVFCQWLLKSSDPWAKIELNFDGLDMDNNDMPPGTICNDILSVYGAGMEKTIPCDGSTVHKMVSVSNWILVELRTNPWSMGEGHSGPSIRYNLITRPSGALAFSDGMTACSSLRSILFASFVILIAKLF